MCLHMRAFVLVLVQAAVVVVVVVVVKVICLESCVN